LFEIHSQYHLENFSRKSGCVNPAKLALGKAEVAIVVANHFMKKMKKIQGI